MRGQDAEVACPQGHLFRDPVVYPEVIGCASRNGGSTEGVPYWRPHLRIEKELDYGDLIVYPVQYLPWDRTEDRVTPGWWGENYPRLAEASANARGRCASRLAAANPVRRSRGTSGRSRRRGRR